MISSAADIGAATLTMGNQHGVAQAFINGSRGMAYMEHKRATTHRSAVHPSGHNTQVVCQICR